jgi:hypothetical protein
MRTRHLAAIGLAAVLLTACGGSDGNGESAKTGPQVAADAANALEKAGAVHLTGGGTISGQETDLDLHLQGNDAKGTIGQGGQKLQVVATGGKFYVQASTDYWTQSGIPASSAAALAGKWVILPSSATTALEQFTIPSLADQIRKPAGAKIKNDVSTGTLDGKKVVVVSQTDGSTLDVASTGTPYPLRTVDKGENPGTVNASDFGKKVTITAPTGALDLSQLGGA